MLSKNVKRIEDIMVNLNRLGLIIKWMLNGLMLIFLILMKQLMMLLHTLIIIYNKERYLSFFLLKNDI